MQCSDGGSFIVNTFFKQVKYSVDSLSMINSNYYRQWLKESKLIHTHSSVIKVYIFVKLMETATVRLGLKIIVQYIFMYAQCVVVHWIALYHRHHLHNLHYKYWATMSQTIRFLYLYYSAFILSFLSLSSFYHRFISTFHATCTQYEYGTEGIWVGL